MKFKGFTLIELMIGLAIITIIATASVPKIQEWAARNRGVQGVSKVISDFTKTMSLAVTTFNEPPEGEYIGEKPQTAILFKESEYFVLQKELMTGGWSEASDRVVKITRLPSKVSLVNINLEGVSEYIPKTVVFTSIGKLKKGDGTSDLYPYKIGGTLQCNGQASPLAGTRIFVAIVKSMIDDSRGIWYRVEIDKNGMHFICSAFGIGNSPPDFSGSIGNPIEI